MTDSKHDLDGLNVYVGDEVWVVDTWSHDFCKATILKITPKGFKVLTQNEEFPDIKREMFVHNAIKTRTEREKAFINVNN